ncbi:peptide ABC transporter ATP-binding protein [Candidatus Desantisbacteria bacterium CG02_land_8_20_14_3_00_49_13]|nr:MAG: peptide ABC transporter ATP-binding protein [Candidatus Desantisbacteria bacterium CG02_land_8_20_14_3_00_49_13]
MNMLKIEHASKTFHHKHGTVSALNDFSFEIKKGEFISISGPSGSGKSTLLLALGGMSHPDNGKVMWNNESIYNWELNKRAQWRAKEVGFIFQTFNLINYLTVYENVAIALNLAEEKVDRKRIIGILDKMKLSNRIKHLPNELSIGQQQRVAIARALIKNPSMLLADEPTGNLDPQTANDILKILKEINNEGKTVVFITHNPDLAKLANRNIRIEEGRIV